MPVYYRRWFIKRIIKENKKIESMRTGNEESVSDNMNKLSQFEKMISKKNS